MKPLSTGRLRELRRSRRVPRRQGAWITVEEDGPRLPCTLWDLSAEGARLAAPRPKSLPACFTLLLSQDGSSQRCCQIVWRNDTQLGVRFIADAEEGWRSATPRAASPPPIRKEPVPGGPGAQARSGPVLNTAPLVMRRPQASAGLAIVGHVFRTLLIGCIAIPIGYQILSRPELDLNARLCGSENVLCEHPQLMVLAALLVVAAGVLTTRTRRH